MKSSNAQLDQHLAILAEAHDQKLQEDANNWRKLVKSSRVRLLGYARGGPKGKDGPIRHIGFELTSDHPDYPGMKEGNAQAIECLLDYLNGVK